MYKRSIKDYIGNRKILYMLLAIALISISTLTIVYAALSVTLNITGTADISAASWDIHLDNVKLNSKSVTATAPTITIEPEENTIWKQSHSATIKIEDNVGLSANAIVEYAWGAENETPSAWQTFEFKNAEGVKEIEGTVLASGYTGKYYLWVRPVGTTLKDLTGNVTVIPEIGNEDYYPSGEFWFDNEVK